MPGWESCRRGRRCDIWPGGRQYATAATPLPALMMSTQSDGRSKGTPLRRKTVEITQAPPREELVRRASGLIPLLREKAAWMEESRRLHDDVLDALTDAGILRMRTPLRYGGYESDTGTVVDVVAELGRGDGSVAWMVGVWMIATWEMGLFPDEAQDEIFANPDARICGILSPTAVAVPVDGGYIINGTLKFNTGVKHSTSNNNASLLPTHNDGFAPQLQPPTAARPRRRQEHL